MARKQKTKKVQISLLPPHDISTADKDIEDLLNFEEADITLLFHVLEQYKPTEEEENLYDLLMPYR